MIIGGLKVNSHLYKFYTKFLCLVWWVKNICLNLHPTLLSITVWGQGWKLKQVRNIEIKADVEAMDECLWLSFSHDLLSLLYYSTLNHKFSGSNSHSVLYDGPCDPYHYNLGWYWITCHSFLSIVTKMTKQLKMGRVYFNLQFEHTAHYGEKSCNHEVDTAEHTAAVFR